MDTRKIDLNLLLTLETLLTEQNVTKAAMQLHLSQPAVSAQLNRLREIFHDPLLIPGRRGMTPTAKALELMTPLSNALAILRQTVQSHERFDPQSASLTVTIACTDYIQAAVIMPLVVALQKLAPGVRIAVRHYDPNQSEHQLRTGQIDAVIATPDAAQTNLKVHHLFNETYVLVGRAGHPELSSSLTMDEFSKQKHIIVSPAGGEFTTPVDSVLAASGLRRQVVMSAASFLFVPGMVAMSDLVALVPRRMIQEPFHQLTVLELPWLREHFEVSLIWHERSHGHAGHRWLRELIIRLNGA
ncbi:LysR family transcriptional regulator [Erwinia oleae]|uniref:LysR family transcriptional regulator n=1 Tax=Erwinia oleae TaxID=796334 RepID=UPI00054F8CB8|nr:LysR family transcriptional regulator [Erwinia oleae]